MSDTKFPVTKVTGMEPGPIPHGDSVKTDIGPSYNEAMNAPNNPKKDHRPGDHDTHDSYNVTDAYTDGDNSK